MRKFRPSPAMAVALIALFVALTGSAGAITGAVVPLAKRALVADNAKKLNGQTASAIAAAAANAASAKPGPASSASGLVVLKSQSGGQIPADDYKELGTLSCDSGQKIVGGGLSSDGIVVTGDSYAQNDTTWAFSALNLSRSPSNITLWITCLK